MRWKRARVAGVGRRGGSGLWASRWPLGAVVLAGCCLEFGLGRLVRMR